MRLNQQRRFDFHIVRGARLQGGPHNGESTRFAPLPLRHLIRAREPPPPAPQPPLRSSRTRSISCRHERLLWYGHFQTLSFAAG